MAELKSTLGAKSATVYRDERESLFGTPIQGKLNQGERQAGFWKSLGQGVAVTGFGYARDQWRSIKDHVQDPETQPLTSERYEELRTDPMTGDKLNIPFEAGITERQFRNRVRRAKRDNFLQTYERSAAGHISHFVGAMGGGMVAPEVLSTVWVGGPAISAATRATTTAGMLRNSFVASAQISSASVPLNIAAQTAVYGEVDPMETVLTGVAPFAFVPPAAAFSRAFTATEKRAAAEAATSDVPTGTQQPPDDYVPVEFRDQFTEYEGGVERWLDDVANNSEEAFEYARGIGLPDDGILEVRQRLFEESSRTPIGQDEIRDLDAIVEYATSETPSPGQVARLTERGLIDVAEEARAAEAAPDFARTPEQRLTVKSLQERRAEVEARFPEARDALRWREYSRAGADSTRPLAQVDEVVTQLSKAIRDRNANAAPAEFRQVARQLIEVSDLDQPTRRVAFRREDDLLRTVESAANGNLRAKKQIAQRLLDEMPENARGDWEALQRNGIEGVRRRFIERKEAELDEKSAQLGYIKEQRRGRRGRPTKAEQRLQEEILAGARELEELLDGVRRRQMKPAREMSVDDLAEIMTGYGFKQQGNSRSTFANTRDLDVDRVSDVSRTRAPERSTEPVSEDQLDEILQYAREQGVDVEQIDNSYGAAARAIRECEI